jgi:PPK2 family polyphosphate:nucleotide phosphotransferase
MKFSQQFQVVPGRRVRLSSHDPDETLHFKDKASATKHLERNGERLGELQEVLYAQGRHTVLIVLQAMDTGGKDGTIEHVMGGFSPLGCRVASFKAPTAIELAHDFLWRVHKAVPSKGEIGIFNRSHYEDVLIVRVHNLVPRKAWRERYQQINDFEEMLASNGVTIVKFFLHISKDEQKERLEARLRDPQKRWKFNARDLDERKLWDDYMKAYEDALTRCTSPHAPWFIIPANHKWFRNLAVSQILVETLEGLKMKFPKPAADLSHIVIR